jgi:hypothetical protein
MMKGSIKWAVWLFLIVATFSIMEGWSLHEGTSTLSRFIWDITAEFPPFPWVAGFLTGFLVAHFWWGGIVSFKPVTMEKHDAASNQ